MMRVSVVRFWMLVIAMVCAACAGVDGGAVSGDERMTLVQLTQAVSGGTCGSPTLSVTRSGNDALLNAGATCSSGTPEFRFWMRAPGGATFSEIYPYGSASHLYTPPASGQYTFIVHVRAVGSGFLYEAATTANGAVGPHVCTTASLAAAPAGKIHSPVRLTATSACTPGTAASYHFLAVQPGASTFTELAPWGPGGTLTWDPTGKPAGVYTFVVHTRGSANSSVYEGAASVPRRLLPGPSTVYRADPELAGSHCPAGGTALNSGPDLDQSGLLDSGAELQSTRYLCSPTTGSTITGDYTIRNATDLAGLSGVSRISGDLTIEEATSLSTVSLPDLVEVAGTIRAWSRYVTDVSFPSLIVAGAVELGGDRELSPPTALHSASFGGLVYTGSLTVQNSPSLVALSLPELEFVATLDFLGRGGSLNGTPVPETDLLQSPSIPKLRGVDAVFIDSMEFTSLSWFPPAVTRIAGHLWIRFCPQLLDMSGLDNVARAGDLQIYYNPRLRSLNGLTLDRIDGGLLFIDQNPQLTSAVLGNLTTASVIIIEQNPLLQTISFPSLTTVTGKDVNNDGTVEGVLIASNPALTGLQLPALQSVGGLLDIQRNSDLSALQLPSLVSTSGLLLKANGLTTTSGFSALQTVNGALTVVADLPGTGLAQNDPLAAVDFPALTSVSGNLEIGIPAGAQISSSVAVIQVPALFAIGGDLSVQHTALANLTLPALTQVIGTTTIGDNDLLATLSLPALTQTTGIFVTHSPRLTSLGLGALTQAGHGYQGPAALYLTTCPRLTSLSRPALTQVDGNIDIESNGLTLISAPFLTQTPGYLQVYNNTALTTLDLPALIKVRTSFVISSNTSLETCRAQAIRDQLTTPPISTTIVGNKNNGVGCP